ncbi:MAG TPA: dihydropyrimidinase [Candidatus Sulfotelmatobacter sp.]|jgi:dihydropyrimidinase|nr:dihydropyrimidinase [Candidatus Sulfotelmatobacter sp.]
MSLLIKNGEIVTADSRYVADIFCEGETITRIDKNISAPKNCKVIDAKGKYVFPGFIDPHVHIYLPFMGTMAKDDYITGSEAALVGGTTTLIEMCCPARKDDTLKSFELWMSQAEGKSACDFTFHMGVTKFDEITEKQLREIVKRGISSFKIFLAYKGAFGIDDSELYRTLKLAKELGVIVTAHCENETLVTERCKELIAAGKTGPGFHEPSRPVQVEAEGVHHLMTFAELTGAATYIVHLSCKEALDQAVAARQRGVRVSVETLIQYLVLDKTYAEKPKFEGAKFVMSPPLRDVRNQEVLWNGLRDGLVQTVATDHAPFDFHKQKEMGKSDFTKIPNGIPSLEERVNLLYTYGVKTGKIDLHTLVNVASTQVAKTFDLFPRKGTIQLGADADLVVFDPHYRGKISVKTQHMNLDYSAFEGWKIEGRPSVVTVRGQIAVRDGKFTGKHGHGKFLARKPGHF